MCCVPTYRVLNIVCVKPVMWRCSGGILRTVKYFSTEISLYITKCLFGEGGDLLEVELVFLVLWKRVWIMCDARENCKSEINLN